MGLENLLKDVKQSLAHFRKGERNRKKRWKSLLATRAFKKNPYHAGKDVLDSKCSTFLQVSKEAMNHHKASVGFDSLYDIPLESLEGLPPNPVMKKQFNDKALKFQEFANILHSRRNASSPGINMIPYKVYKKCPQIASFLFNLFKSCLRHSIIPVQWRIVSEVYIPKVKPPVPSNIKDFRPIALLNVEGKLFFSLISQRLENHIIKENNFIDKSIQKGCMEKVPGCWEHMSVVWSSLKAAKADHSNLAAIWLDIANAYGSVPHKLIFFALERYGVPKLYLNLIRSYYIGLWSKSFSNNAPSDWHQHQKGIFIGCTASIILFLSAMNVLIEFICHHHIDLSLSTPPVKAFMDDLFLMSSSVEQTKSLLDRCVTALSWCGMSFRAPKSRSIVICKGKIVDKSPFSVSFVNERVSIPSIHSKPVRFLGRSIESSLSDKSAMVFF